jgi:phytoene synthase
MTGAPEVSSSLAQLVRARDRERFQTALFAPASRREALFALYAFNYEVAKTREMVREPMLGRMRLQWWREAIAAIYEGGPLRRHEAVEPLAAAIRAHGLTRAHFEALIEAREADLADAPPPTLAALAAYAEDSAGRLVLLALEILGVRDGDAAAAGREVGIAYAMAGLLRAVPFHARQRRLYLPADLVAEARLDVARGLFELKTSRELREVVAQVAAQARGHLAAARARRRAVAMPARPALLPAVLADRWLERLARVGHDPFDPRLAAPEQGQILRLALTAWRGRY